MEVRGVCVSMLFVCVCLLCVAAHQRMCVHMPQHVCKCEVTLCVSELRNTQKTNCFFDYNFHIHTHLHVGVTFLLISHEKTQSGTRTFHDVRLKKPLTFHNG